MPYPRARSTVSRATRVPIEDDARCRRLQQQIGCTTPHLISKALEELERSLNASRNGSANESAA
jgi:hypothetical protein